MTKVLAVGTWIAKAGPKKGPQIMPSEARDTLRRLVAPIAATADHPDVLTLERGIMSCLTGR